MRRDQAIAHRPSRLRALTSLEPDEFAALVPTFHACVLKRMQRYTLDGLPHLNRRYMPDKTSLLPATEDKLLCMLVHIKQNLTQAVQGHMFGMSQSDANTWVQGLRPVVLQTWEQWDVVPDRLTAGFTARDPSSVDQAPCLIMMARHARSNDRSTGTNNTNATAAPRSTIP